MNTGTNFCVTSAVRVFSPSKAMNYKVHVSAIHFFSCTFIDSVTSLTFIPCFSIYALSSTFPPSQNSIVSTLSEDRSQWILGTFRKLKCLKSLSTLSQFLPSWRKSSSSGRFLFVSSASHMYWKPGKTQAMQWTKSCRRKLEQSLKKIYPRLQFA